MINPKDNHDRNQVMRSIKFEQMKRRWLHDFLRTQKENILRDRNHSEDLRLTEPTSPKGSKTGKETQFERYERQEKIIKE